MRGPGERRAAGGTALEAREAGSCTRRALEEALRTALGAGVALASPAMEFGTATAVREAVWVGSARLPAGPARDLLGIAALPST